MRYRFYLNPRTCIIYITAAKFHQVVLTIVHVSSLWMVLFLFSGKEFVRGMRSKIKPMKQLTRLYENNVIVAFICDAIALIVFAVSAIFTIAVVTIAFTL